VKEFIDILKERDITPKEAEEIYVRIKDGEDASEWMHAVFDALKSGRTVNFISSFPAYDKRYESVILQMRNLISPKNRILGAMVFNIDLKYENTSGLEVISESEDGFVFKRILSDRFGVINDLLEKSCPGYLSMLSYEASDLFVGDKKRDRPVENLPLENFSMFPFVEAEKVKFLWYIGVPIIAFREDYRLLNPSFDFFHRRGHHSFKIRDSKLVQKVLYGTSHKDIDRAAKQYGINKPKLKDVPDILYTMLFNEITLETQEDQDEEWVDITI